MMDVTAETSPPSNNRPAGVVWPMDPLVNPRDRATICEEGTPRVFCSSI